MATDSALAQVGNSALSVAQLEMMISQKTLEVSEAAQRAAPLRWQL